MTELSGYPAGIGDYEIRGVLGTGTSGTVFLAYQERLERRVALKELTAELTADPVFRERFRAEAELMARLDDENCVRVFDYFQQEDHDYLVTELVEGASLRRILQHAGRLTPEEALGVVKGALLGLARAHDLGLLHRDIKPENVLVDSEGTSKLADFGQATSQAGPGAAGGMPGGSPAYMSPEMVGGGVLDTRSDIYSVGAMLYELLTGRPPFIADNPLAVMRMHREAPARDARELNPALGAGMAALLRQALAKDPEVRPVSARQMLSMLQSRAADAYGADWEARSSIRREVAATVGAGLGLLALLDTAGAADAVGTVGEAMTAVAAQGAAISGGLLGVGAWAIAAGVAGVLMLGGGAAYAGTHGYFGGKSASVLVALAIPTPTAVISPTHGRSPSPSPQVTPSPTPGPSPSPSPAPALAPSPSPTGAPIAPPLGPITITNIQMVFVKCDGSGNNCANPITGTSNQAADASQYSKANAYQLGNCSKLTLKLWETYSWSYPGAAGTRTAVTVRWSGQKAVGGTNITVADLYQSDLLASGSAGSHAPMVSPPEFAPTSNMAPTGGNVTFNLNWSNPNDHASPTSALPYSFWWGCG